MTNTHLISDCGSDRATAYDQSSKIIRSNGVLYVGWLDAASGAVGPSRQRLAECSALSGEIIHSEVVGTAFDNHCGPALALDGARRLHAMLGAHHQPFYYRWADAASEFETSERLQWSETQPLESEATYPAMVADADGTLHLAYRGGGEYWQLLYRRKPAGYSWEEPHVIAVSPARGYSNFSQSLSIGPTGTLHLLFQFLYADQEGQSPTGRQAVHLKSADGGRTWWNEGSRCQFPLAPGTCRPFLSAENLKLVSGHITDAEDRPWVYATWLDQPGGVLLRGGTNAWEQMDMSSSTRALNVAGSLDVSLSRSANGHIHLVLSANPNEEEPAAWFDPRNEIFHLVLSEAGLPLSFHQITQTDSTTACWLPNMEKWNWVRCAEACSDGPWLLYTRGWNLNNAWGDCRNSLRTEVHLTHLSDAS